MASTPNAPTNLSMLSTRRKFLEGTRTPAPALMRTPALFPAIIVTDSAPPSVPQNFTATAVSNSQINLSWSASTDTGGSGLQGYRVYRNGSGTPLVQQAGTTYSDTGLLNATQYDYRVSAYDVQGNESTQSTLASATTQSQGGGGAALQDWLDRATIGVNGVVQAIRFPSAANVNAYIHHDSAQANLVFDAADGILGDGCLKINVPSGDGSNSGNWRAPMNASWITDGQGFGSTAFYIQFRVKLGPNRLTPSNNGGGFKLCNLSEYRFSSPDSSASHPANEIVVNNQNWRGILGAYREHPVGGPTSFETTDGNGDIHLQTAVDNGSGISDKFARYCLYQSGNGSTGCWRFHEQEWFTIYYRIQIADYGGSGTGNAIDIYVARDGETSYTQLFNNRNFVIGADGTLPQGINGIWLLPYDTNRTNASYTTWHKYDQVIVSTQPIACPQVAAQTPSAAPTWFASTASKQWVTPLGNSLNSVLDPLGNSTNSQSGPRNILEAYSGMAMDPQAGEIRLLGNGGHSGYLGNEVYRTILKTNTPAWVRQRNATSSAGFTTGANYATWPSDGRPGPAHTYSMTVGGNGRFFAFGRAGLDYNGGSANGNVWEFVAANPGATDNANNDWVNRTSTANITGSTNTGNMCSFYDAATNQFISVAGGNVAPMIVVLNATTLATVSRNNGNFADGCAELNGAIDTFNRVLLIHGTNGSTGASQWSWIKLSALASGSFTLISMPTDIGTTVGFDYDPVNRVFVTYTGGQLKKLVPTVNGAGNYTSLSGWTNVSGVTGSAPPSAAGAGLMGKCKVIHDMGDGRSALCLLPAWQSPDLYVMPLSSGSL